MPSSSIAVGGNAESPRLEFTDPIFLSPRDAHLGLQSSLNGYYTHPSESGGDGLTVYVQPADVSGTYHVQIVVQSDNPTVTNPNLEFSFYEFTNGETVKWTKIGAYKISDATPIPTTAGSHWLDTGVPVARTKIVLAAVTGYTESSGNGDWQYGRYAKPQDAFWTYHDSLPLFATRNSPALNGATALANTYDALKLDGWTYSTATREISTGPVVAAM